MEAAAARQLGVRNHYNASEKASASILRFIILKLFTLFHLIITCNGITGVSLAMADIYIDPISSGGGLPEVCIVPSWMHCI